MLFFKLFTYIFNINIGSVYELFMIVILVPVSCKKQFDYVCWPVDVISHRIFRNGNIWDIVVFVYLLDRCRVCALYMRINTRQYVAGLGMTIGSRRKILNYFLQQTFCRDSCDRRCTICKRLFVYFFYFFSPEFSRSRMRVIQTPRVYIRKLHWYLRTWWPMRSPRTRRRIIIII